MIRDAAVPLLAALRAGAPTPVASPSSRRSPPRPFFASSSLGVLAGIDGAAGSSGREKARSVAGTLAEQDQERMRGMRAVDLSNYSWTATSTVGGATYRIAVGVRLDP